MSELDLRVVQWCADHRAPWATSVAKALEWVGESPIAWILIIVVAVLSSMALGRLVTLLAAGGALLVAGGATLVLKQVVERPRPPVDLAIAHTVGWSMPSTSAALVLAPSVALVLVPRWRAAARTVVAALVGTFNLVLGAAVVYLGAHWPSDVLAGWAVGLVAGLGLAVPARAFLRAPVPVVRD